MIVATWKALQPSKSPGAKTAAGDGWKSEWGLTAFAKKLIDKSHYNSPSYDMINKHSGCKAAGRFYWEGRMKILKIGSRTLLFD